MNYKVNKFNIILTREFEELEEKEIKATKHRSKISDGINMNNAL